MEVSGEKVKLHLDIDETQNKDKAAWFRYAPTTGNLMYSMPIVGTNANLYFSSERSEDPIVIGCIRKNGSSCESFSDVNNRYFATESGNNLDMLPGAINFSRPGLSANFNDGSGINLSSSSSLNISAGYVGIYAGDITIKAKSKLEAKKGESSFISLENDFYNNAGIVMENGSDKASNGAFDDDPQKGAAEAKKAKAAMESAVKVALAAVVGAVQGAMGKIGECLAGVGNNASSTSNVDLRDSNNKSLMNTQTDVAGYKKDETYITKASKNVKPIDTDPYRVHVGESGDGFWGKVADIWVSTPVYKCLASMARWQDNHQQEMELLNIGMIFAGVTAATVSLPMAENECEIANKNDIKVTNKSSSILDEELEKIISGTKGAAKFKYKSNPMDNPKAAKDILENSDAVYGFSPKKGGRLDDFVDMIDWTDAEQVASARAQRIAYHNKMSINLESKVKKLLDDGYSMEDIAKNMINERNQNRINTYIKNGNYEGLEGMYKSNLKEYGNAEGPTYEYMLKKCVSNEEIINSSIKSNLGMDACTGLYDEYFKGGN